MDFIGTDKCILYDLYIHCTVFTPHLFLTAIAPPSLTAVIYFRVQGMVQGYVYPSAEISRPLHLWIQGRSEFPSNFPEAVFNATALYLRHLNPSPRFKMLGQMSKSWNFNLQFLLAFKYVNDTKIYIHYHFSVTKDLYR